MNCWKTHDRYRLDQWTYYFATQHQFYSISDNLYKWRNILDIYIHIYTNIYILIQVQHQVYVASENRSSGDSSCYYETNQYVVRRMLMATWIYQNINKATGWYNDVLGPCIILLTLIFTYSFIPSNPELSRISLIRR